MSKIIIILIAGFLICLLTGNALSGSGDVLIALPSPTDIRIGKGCTTAYHIDEDCDGYGVGPGLLGPDADDNDATVNTTATVEAKYGALTNLANIKKFLCAARGYCNIQDIFFIATNGNDSTGAPNDITKPFLTYNAVHNHYKFGAGDLVLYRGGTHTNHCIGTQYGGKEGTASAPIIIMSFPGELAILAKNDGQYPLTKINCFDNEYYIFDTFQLGLRDTDTGGDGINVRGLKGFQFRYIEAVRNNTGMDFMTGIENINENVLLERSVFSQSTGSHNIYWGCNKLSMKNKNLTVRRIISHSNKSGYEGMQHNGYVDGLIIEDSIFHSSQQNGLNILNGVENSIIRNNVIFNNNYRGIHFYTYSTTWTAVPKNNLVEGNTIYIGRYANPNDPAGEPYASAAIKFQNSANVDVMTGNIFRSNIFVIWGDGEPIIESQDREGHLASSSFQNNVFYMMNGGTIVARVGPSGGGTTYNLAQFHAKFGNLCSKPPCSYGNVLINPMFTDASVNYNNFPGKYNFDLLAGSPAINLGIPSKGLTLDLKGGARLGNPDAGCYEFGATTSPRDTIPPNAPSALKVIP